MTWGHVEPLKVPVSHVRMRDVVVGKSNAIDVTAGLPVPSGLMHSVKVALGLADQRDQLQVLNDRISKTLIVRRIGVGDLAAQLQNLSALSLFGGSNRSPNPDYPKEDSQEFIRKMFEAKKIRIKRDLDVE